MIKQHLNNQNRFLAGRLKFGPKLLPAQSICYNCFRYDCPFEQDDIANINDIAEKLSKDDHRVSAQNTVDQKHGGTNDADQPKPHRQD